MDDLEEVEIGTSTASFERFLDSHKDLIHNQIDQLQRIVVAQCKLTAVNPLSQEMAAGALSIKIGKKPRDLLNPKAVKYMQAVFSIKDAISKKECREISAQFGVSATQVRDFFNSQRTRVRKQVRLSREKAARAVLPERLEDAVYISGPSNVELAPPNDFAPNSSVSNCDGHPPLPLNSFDESLVPLNSFVPGVVPVLSADQNSCTGSSAITNPVPLNSVDPSIVVEAASSSMQGDTLPGLDGLEKHFVDNIFGLLRKVETFSGQVKLMEWILQINTPLVLNWFLDKGGAMILATWLSIAASEEQTSVLFITLKVFCHLPLHTALPEHMSAILQCVNKLRFYRTPDISNRARVLLSKWSRMFARNQAMKKQNGTKSLNTAQEMLLKQSIEEVMGDELWQPVCDPGHMLTPPVESLENKRRIDSSQNVKILTASTDDASRKQILGISGSNDKKRRKVQLVDQPGQTTANKSTQAIKLAATNHSRPMSADDIQKAKLRALYKQSKYGKTISSLPGNHGTKPAALNKPASSSVRFSPSPVSTSPIRPKIEEEKKPPTAPHELFDTVKDQNNVQQKVEPKEPLEEMCKKVQIPWQTPPEVVINDLWRVGCGENSKELDVQKNRNQREMEILYCMIHDIPSNPREPWDLEMDYDDTWTPEIPIEQQPGVDNETDASNDEHIDTSPASNNEHIDTSPASNNEHIDTSPASVPALPHVPALNASEPDLELLAALLKNPDLVFALTNGRGGNLSTDETVRLLDMIKMGGAGGTTGLNGLGGNVGNKVEVSLPSPTPSNNSGTSGWRPEVARNPFSRQNAVANRVKYLNSGVPHNGHSPEKPSNSSVRSPQQQVSVPLISQQVQFAGSLSSHHTSRVIPENHLLHVAASSMSHAPQLDAHPTKNSHVTTPSMGNFPAGFGQSRRFEYANVGPTPSGSVPANYSERQHTSFLSTPTPAIQAPSRLQQQSHHITEPSPSFTSRLHSGGVGQVGSWSGRQGLAPSSRYEVNQTNYDATFGGPGRPQSRLGPPRARNQIVDDAGFESWSPENSPSRSAAYMQPRRSHPGLSTNSGWNENRSRQRYPPREQQHRNDNRRWR